MRFKNKDAEEKWTKVVEVNSNDFYGRGIIDFAEKWAELMETEIEGGNELVDIAERSINVADTDGITGYMYGVAVNSLSDVWYKGDELRAWHNSRYGVESGGVVNSAIIEVGE